MKTEKEVTVKNEFEDYPEKHKRIMKPSDCKCCNMRQTHFCKEYCINALIER